MLVLCVSGTYMFFICRTDPHLPDLPIVYASDAFLKLTGDCHVHTCYKLLKHSLLLSFTIDFCTAHVETMSIAWLVMLVSISFRLDC